MLKKLKEMSEITMGQSPDSKYYNSCKKGLPFIQGRTTFGRLFPYYDTWTTQYSKVAQVNDLLMSVRAPVGDLNFCQTLTALGRGVASIRGKGIDTKYLYYLLLANKDYILTRSTGSVYDSISKSDLENLIFDVHNKQKQQHIVNILGSLDDKIENNEKMTKQFETLNRLYFHKNYILADKKDWKIELLGNCVDITRGSSPRPIQDYLSNKGMPWVKISDATENDSNYLTKTKEFIKENGINLSKTVIPNTLIVSNSATPGLPKIMKITACVHDGWLIFTNYKDLTKEFVKYVIDFNKKELISSGNGSVFTNLKTEILKALKIYLPPKNILEQMNNYLKANLDIQYKLECNNIKLQELKQLYLKKFFG